MQEKGNQCAVSWAVRIKEELGADWAKVGLRQLSGLLCLVFGRQSIMVSTLLAAAHSEGTIC